MDVDAFKIGNAILNDWVARCELPSRCIRIKGRISGHCLIV